MLPQASLPWELFPSEELCKNRGPGSPQEASSIRWISFISHLTCTSESLAHSLPDELWDGVKVPQQQLPWPARFQLVAVTKRHALMSCRRVSWLHSCSVLLLCGRRKQHSSEHLLTSLWSWQLRRCFLSPTTSLARWNVTRCQSSSLGEKSPFRGRRNWGFCVH